MCQTLVDTGYIFNLNRQINSLNWKTQIVKMLILLKLFNNLSGIKIKILIFLVCLGC